MAAIDPFTCYACGTDLSQLVHRAVFGRPLPTVDADAAPGEIPIAQWRVVVTCPTDSVQNAFDSHAAHRGTPPESADLFWAKAAEQIDVSKSLERIDGFAKFLLGLYTLVGALLGGAGLLTDSSFDLTKINWIVLALAPMALSFALAILSITPKFDVFNPADLDSVRTHYTAMLNTRGTRIRWSGILFALSLLLAVPGFWLSHAITRTGG